MLVMEFLKAGLKYFLIFGYVWLLYKYCEKYMKRKKMKKVWLNFYIVSQKLSKILFQDFITQFEEMEEWDFIISS